ncbi:16S rRNA C1402 N4-methylase RsmH [Kroppenstedtia sanguinis]|uniref:Class I SAM-dependent methyltransferase n=1 Tax=Kroppenstedtia sanguinis TaxID=1380684 RepID=A0ABW4CC05_9BACL
MSLPSTLTQAHHWVKSVLNPGSLVVDATVGNGNDTLFLAQAVGSTGQVHGFDIQQEALDRTGDRLRKAGLSEQVTLHRAGHEQMAKTLPLQSKGKVQAIMFNLGYLPRGNPRVITRADTTLLALEQALEWLAPGGILTVMLYTGHPGGIEEAEKVVNLLKRLDAGRFRTVSCQTLNRHQAPMLTAVAKSNKSAEIPPVQS